MGRVVKVKSESEIHLPTQALIENCLATFSKMSNRDIFNVLSHQPDHLCTIESETDRKNRAKELGVTDVPTFDALRKQRLEEQIRSVRYQWDKRMSDIKELTENMDECKTFSLDDIPDENIERIKIGDDSIDNIFGDGLTPGVFGPVLGKTYLIGGAEGVGKSRFMIACVGSLTDPEREDIAEKMENTGSKAAAIYFQAEVPLPTFKQWAAGKIKPKSRVIVSEKNRLEDQLALIESQKPLAVVVDSLHMILECDGFAGVYRTINTYRHHAMNHGYSLFLICHLNKSGDIAGSKKISYVVDCILKAQGGLIPGQFTLSCPNKNRYGRNGVSILCQHTRDGVQVINSERGRANGSIFAGPKPAIVLNQNIVSTNHVAPKPNLEIEDNTENKENEKMEEHITE